QFAGARYGTLRSEVEQKTKLGQRVILEIELAGARQIMKSSPEAAFIFIAPPNLEVLRDRLLQRGTEGPAEITDRIRIAQEEIAAQAEFDIVLINDDLEASFEQLLNYCESL
ncbi:MAG: guanylate kinase, partial [Candidatus Nanopelagicales bacterium]